jgi:hypothetical protein
MILIRAFGILYSVLVLSTTAPAADLSAYGVSAEATRTGDKVAIRFKLSYTARDAGRVEGHPVDVTNERSGRVILLDGKRASLVVSLDQQAAAGDPGDRKPIANLDDIESGFRVDVISIKGADKILITASVVEKGATTWADSKLVNVVVKPERGQN